MAEPWPAPAVRGLLLYTRAGFESEAEAELGLKGPRYGWSGDMEATRGSGFVRLRLRTESLAAAPLKILPLDILCFARQRLEIFAEFVDLPRHDRLSPLLEALVLFGRPFSDVWLETADTNEAKQLNPLLRALARPFDQALRERQLLDERSPRRLHVFFESGTAVTLGSSPRGDANAWPMGIPRLRFPSGAPSRSTLKLEEAFQTFLQDPEAWPQPGMSAVDLGAAPGGWTFQLVRRHVRTTAVDNGPIDKALLATGLVDHQRCDGFRYRPPKPVDWLVCDIVEQPDRIAQLVAEWLARGWCRQAIFNLKLPMKQRWLAVDGCRQRIEKRLKGLQYHLAMKQLYHDREEITVYLKRFD